MDRATTLVSSPHLRTATDQLDLVDHYIVTIIIFRGVVARSVDVQAIWFCLFRQARISGRETEPRQTASRCNSVSV